jgi:hypothetical protein
MSKGPTRASETYDQKAGTERTTLKVAGKVSSAPKCFLAGQPRQAIGGRDFKLQLCRAVALSVIEPGEHVPLGPERPNGD